MPVGAVPGLAGFGVGAEDLAWVVGTDLVLVAVCGRGDGEERYRRRDHRRRGVILAATFVALAQLPSISVTEIGTAIAIGVLLDTALVCTVLVPHAHHHRRPHLVAMTQPR